MAVPDLRVKLEQGVIPVLMEWRDELDTEDLQETVDPQERLEPEVKLEHPELTDTPAEMGHPEPPDTVETPVTLATLELHLTRMETLDLLDPLEPLDLPVMHLLDPPDPLEGLELRDPQELLVPLENLVKRESVELMDPTECGWEEAAAMAKRAPQEEWDPPELPWIQPMLRSTSTPSTPKPCSLLYPLPVETSQDGPTLPRDELILPPKSWKDSVAVTLEPPTDLVLGNRSAPVVLVSDSSRSNPMLSAPTKCARSMVTITVYG